MQVGVTKPDCDVLVGGGGPAGSTISALLAEKGWRVKLLEKERHPRFHIGESLLPWNLPILERLGVLDQVHAIGIKKPGADFNSGLEVEGHHQFHFSFALDKSQPYAYEVRRSEFDHLLLRNSAAKGTEVVEGVRVTRVEFPKNGDPIAHAVDEQGEKRTYTSRFVVDASGRDTLLSGQFQLKKKNPHHASAAIFGHFRDVERRLGEYEGNISVYWFEHGWFWMIPLRDGTMSVGAGCRPAYLKQRGNGIPEYLLQTIAIGHPEMRHRMRNAVLIDNVARATGNYSYQSTRMRGDRHIMVGDAYAFVDPVFSSGVYLAMQSAFDGAKVVEAMLDGRREAATLRRAFDRNVQRGPREFSWFIFRVTNPTMREFFMSPQNPFRVKEALVSLLAGDIYGRTPIWPSIRILKALYYLVSIGNLGRTVRAWKRRRVNIRDVGAQAS